MKVTIRLRDGQQITFHPAGHGELLYVLPQVLRGFGLVQLPEPRNPEVEFDAADVTRIEVDGL